MKYCLYNAVSKTYVEITEAVYNLTPDTKLGGKDLRCANTDCSKCGGGGGGGGATTKYKCVSGVCQSGTSADYTFATLTACQASCGGGGGGGGGGAHNSYRDCTGDSVRSRGCTDTDGKIKEVQKCIGFTGKWVDGKFGSKTKEQLKAKTGKDFFLVDDISKICSGSSGSEDGSNVVRVPERKPISWDTLIDNEQIYRGGYQYELQDGSIVYMIKYVKDTDETIPMTDGLNANLDEHDVVVLFPVKEGDKKGSYGILERYITKNGETKTRIKKDRNFTWEVEAPIESIDLAENKIRQILNNILNEQKLSNRPKGVNPATKPVEDVSTDVTQQKQEVVDITPELQKMKDQALSVVDQWDNYNEGLKGLSPRALGKSKVNELIDDSRSQLQATDAKNFCSQDIDGQLAEIQSTRKDYGYLMTDEDKSYLSQIESLLKRVKAKCSEPKQTVTQQGGSTTTKTPEQKPEVEQTPLQKTEELPPIEMDFSREECRNKIKELHLAAFPPRLRRDESDIEDLPKMKAEVVWCAKEYPFGKVLGVKDELEELIKCRTEKFRKLDRGRQEFCFTRAEMDQIELKTESTVRKQVNNLLTEKRNSKTNISSVISEAVVAKRKEKTRDVIAEDLIRMIKGY